MTDRSHQPIADPLGRFQDAASAAVQDAAGAADETTDALAGLPDSGSIARFPVGGAELIVEEHGSGPRLFLLLHGIGMGRKVFGDIIGRLSPHGRVWAIDQPGYGEAPEPPRTPTIERMADWVAALLRDRGELGAIVIGHSMGTQVAVELAVRHPELVSALALAGPTVDADARSARRQLARLCRDLFIESPRVLLLGAREYLRAGPNLRRKLRAMLVHRPEDAYPRVEVPVVVIRGEHDYVAPRGWCERVAALLPKGRLVELAGHGHETLIRDGGPAAAAIRGLLVEA